MAVETIFSSALFSQIIFPFLLVFVLVFAILDKTRILGEGKRQINAIISLVIALMFISFANAVGIVVRLMPFLVIMLVIILVFYLLVGFVFNEKEGLNVPRGIKIAGGIVILVALLIAVLVVTDYWNRFLGLFAGNNATVSTIILLVAVGAALAIVLSTGKK